MLERTIDAAERSVHMAYWTLDPAVELQSDVEGDCWIELLLRTLRRGVTIRVLITDFDPLLVGSLHRAAWARYRRLSGLLDQLDEDQQRLLQIVCSRHEARVGTAVRIIGQPLLQHFLRKEMLRLRRAEKKAGREGAASLLKNHPGLWPLVRESGGRYRRRWSRWPDCWPAVHHEKLCVVDDRIVLLGGFDIDADRLDDKTHRSERPWHDVACKVTGPVAAAFARHFHFRWNRELADFQKFLKETPPPEGVEPMPVSPWLAPIDGEEEVPVPAADGEGVATPLRTLSVQGRSSFSRSPRPDVVEIRSAMLDVIGSARELIYIETQFLRSKAIADALIRRLAERPGLEVVMVLPKLPDAYFEPGGPDPASRHAHGIQHRLLRRLRQAGGDRFGCFIFQKDGPLDHVGEKRNGQVARDAVYVHSKILIADDERCILGSANLNDRSMVTDTETAILWEEPEAVSAFRQRLWEHALGAGHEAAAAPYLPEWNALATGNVDAPPDRRRGIVMPMPESAERNGIAFYPFVPPELV